MCAKRERGRESGAMFAKSAHVRCKVCGRNSYQSAPMAIPFPKIKRSLGEG